MVVKTKKMDIVRRKSLNPCTVLTMATSLCIFYFIFFLNGRARHSTWRGIANVLKRTVCDI